MLTLNADDRFASASLSNLLDNIHILATPTRSIAELAQELDVPKGAIINPVLCAVAGKPTLVLMAGDKACDAAQVARVLNMKGTVSMMSDQDIEALTGAGIDQLFPVDLSKHVPTVLDASLKRFDTVYSRAGNVKCLIATSFAELKSLTGGVISYAVACPTWHPTPFNQG